MILSVFSIGFPIVPLKNETGEIDGHEYFVYERVSKPLSEVATNHSFHVSKDDKINIAIQILDILQFLFAKNKVLKNLDVRDFCLRRTTKGYRVILLNQDFHEKGALLNPNDEQGEFYH